METGAEELLEVHCLGFGGTLPRVLVAHCLRSGGALPKLVVLENLSAEGEKNAENKRGISTATGVFPLQCANEPERPEKGRCSANISVVAEIFRLQLKYWPNQPVRGRVSPFAAAKSLFFIKPPKSLTSAPRKRAAADISRDKWRNSVGTRAASPFYLTSRMYSNCLKKHVLRMKFQTITIHLLSDMELTSVKYNCQVFHSTNRVAIQLEPSCLQAVDVAVIPRYGINDSRDRVLAIKQNLGLLRCGKSCRLRWVNYLKTDLKKGNITLEEEETIIKLRNALGNRYASNNFSTFLFFLFFESDFRTTYTINYLLRYS
ncbi:hypothetical protein L484_013198 [Morus notabilis]|uniref:HTH myb-type domain-containing protein n=1 Tax=Morus notabilis TaxID=981085 RepID=W9RPW6_9ROSA|nr:hypothetical protein L484_013198 [Morus notabilis]